MPWSMVSTGKMLNSPPLTASITSWRSIRCLTLEIGIITPCSPLKPRALQTSKKPSIFSLTPPMACTSPCWLTEPVTAKDCLIGASASAESRA